MEIISAEQINEALLAVGVAKGDVIYLQTDLRTPGVIKEAKNKNEFCKVYYDAIFDIIGVEGTLVVPTYTTQIARFNMDFIWEDTPSLFGIFSEYVRCQTNSLRSLHPLNSVCAVGKDKEFICKDNGTNDYGIHSPFHRMLLKKAKILTIGLESGYVVGIAHHLEASYCVPYVYNKLLKWHPIVKGHKESRAFFATVRYLHLDVEYDLTKWVKHMRQMEGIKSYKLGGSFVHFSDYEQVYHEGSIKLNEDPFYFLKRIPEFTYGQLPFDGPTGGKDGIASASDNQKLQEMNWLGYYLLGKGYVGGDEDDFI